MLTAVKSACCSTALLGSLAGRLLSSEMNSESSMIGTTSILVSSNGAPSPAKGREQFPIRCIQRAVGCGSFCNSQAGRSPLSPVLHTVDAYRSRYG